MNLAESFGQIYGRWRQLALHWRLAGLLPLLAIVIGLATVAWRRSQFDFVEPNHGPIVEAVYALGVVKADREFRLKVAVPSYLSSVAVREGDMVRKGQELLRTDSGVFAAPFEGMVTSVAEDAGATVLPGVPLLTMVDVRERHLLVSLEQESVLRVRRGQKVEASFESLRGEKLHGQVERVYPSDGQFFVRIQVDALPPAILPEMTADVAIEIARRENALLVPAAALRQGKLRVLRDGRVQEINVSVGVADGEQAEILSGLKDGDRVAIKQR